MLDTVEKHHLREKVYIHIARGQFEFALDEVNYTLDKYPNHPRALLLLGAIAQSIKKPSLAIPYFEKALKLFPQYALTYAQFGTYLVEVGQSEAGIERLKQAIEMDPKLVPAHVWLARAYYKTGNKDLAHEAAERAKELGYKGKVLGEVPEKIGIGK